MNEFSTITFSLRCDSFNISGLTSISYFLPSGDPVEVDSGWPAFKLGHLKLITKAAQGLGLPTWLEQAL